MVRSSHKGCIHGTLAKEVKREPSKSPLIERDKSCARYVVPGKKIFVRDHRMNGAVTALLLSRSRPNDLILHNGSFIVSHSLLEKMSYKAPKTDFVVLADCLRQ